MPGDGLIHWKYEIESSSLTFKKDYQTTNHVKLITCNLCRERAERYIKEKGYNGNVFFDYPGDM